MFFSISTTSPLSTHTIYGVRLFISTIYSDGLRNKVSEVWPFGAMTTPHTFAPIQRGARETPSGPASSGDRNQADFAAVVKSPLPRSESTGFDTVLVKYLFCDRIGRTVIPSGIVIEVEFDRRNRASANVRTPPAAGSRQEFNSNFEI